MKKSLSIKLTIWGASFFLIGIIMLIAGDALVDISYISAGQIFILVAIIVGIIGMFSGNSE